MRRINRILAGLVACVLAVSSLTLAPAFPAKAASNTRKLTLASAISRAIEKSTAVERIESQIASKKAAYSNAVKKLRLKEKNMKTFRWSPLLNFHFPETPNESEAFDFAFKAASIQVEIDKLQHKLTDAKIAEREKINNLFVDIYAKEITIDFNEKRLSAVNRAIVSTQAKVAAGTAKEADLKTMLSSQRALTSKISADENMLLSKKKKLSTALGYDVTTGYTFEKPTIEAKIKRTQLPAIRSYTLDRDQTYYEARLSSDTALMSLKTNYNLMSSKYGGEMWPIDNYVSLAILGMKISAKDFKKSYDQFIQLIDSHWQGKKKILIFIKIPRIWMKGDLDGSRYIEDDPYVLYQDTLDYQDARLEKEATHDEVVEAVNDGFDNYINMRNAYSASVEAVDRATLDMKAAQIQNVTGQMTYEEYKEELDTFEEAQLSMIQSLTDYTSQLYSYDRETCGAISAILYGNGLDIEAAEGGESFVTTEYAEGAYYFINSIIQDTEYKLTIKIPEEFPVDITHFELWNGDKQIGTRTAKNGTIRHLTLSKTGAETLKIRLYNEDEFICDCEIDPTETMGALLIPSKYAIDGAKTPLGSFAVSTNSTTGFVSISFKPVSRYKIKYVRLKTADGKYLGAEEYHDVSEAFTYLPLLHAQIGELSVEYYDESKNLLYKGYFDTANFKLMRDPEEEAST